MTPTRPDRRTDDLDHSHDFLGKAHDDNARRTIWVVILTAVMMVGEIAAGIIFGSMALLADGLHMATHAGALGIAAAAYAFAKRNSGNPKFSFGTGKVGDLAGFGSAMVLGAVSLGIAVESFSRLLNPSDVAFGPATLVAVLGLGVNLLSAALLGGGRHHHHHGHSHGHDHDHDHDRDHHDQTNSQPAEMSRDNNLRAAYLHVLADALTSVLAIIALLAGRFLNWVWLDPLMGIVGAIVIARWSWSLVRETADVLLDASNRDLEDRIHHLLKPLDLKLFDLHVWRVGPEAHAAIISFSGQADPRAVRALLTDVSEVKHLTIEQHEALSLDLGRLDEGSFL